MFMEPGTAVATLTVPVWWTLVPKKDAVHRPFATAAETIKHWRWGSKRASRELLHVELTNEMALKRLQSANGKSLAGN